MRKYPLFLAALLLAACMASGPQKALNEMADAMDNNNGQAFLSHVDMSAFSENYINNMTQNSDALNSLSVLGQIFDQALGMGSLNELIGSVVDMQKRLSDQFNRGVSSGELMAECRKATTPDCPWVPSSLREAKIVEIGPEAAIARITTPAKLTSWLALRKIGGKWLVTGQAVLEATARRYATGVRSAGGESGQDATRL